MLRTLQDLENCAMGATDGPIGRVLDFYFDDAAWVVRYLVVDTGSWLNSRKVLISPLSVHQPDYAAHLLPVRISRAQVENSPDIDTDKPVSRQHEEAYLGYYGFPSYWAGAGLAEEGLYPSAMLAEDPRPAVFGTDAEERLREQEAYKQVERERHRLGNPHLRSCKAITGYRIQATDGEIGHVEGLLFDEDSWAIRHIIVNTSNWWLGHKVLVAPQSITAVNWGDASVSVDLDREAIKLALSFEAGG
jgi:uncharacterized protein YrrD